MFFDGVSQRAFQRAPHAFSFATSVSPQRVTLIDGTLEVAEGLVGRLGHLLVRLRQLMT